MWTQRVWTRLLVPVLGFSSEFRASDPQVIIFGLFGCAQPRLYRTSVCTAIGASDRNDQVLLILAIYFSLSSALVMLTLIAFARHNMSMGVLPVTGTVVPLMFSTMCMMP